ncbi:hypothetical protein C1Y40_04946 [Mycobacterium talmoniae]|uniref:Uncharacterized protein n=1 Tax=Mycobacterium talmoniae TaxID=1858794 RepID=A0A2S8BE39_9MYCO|nr:hypothetical protein C1Y40_04946 [Mycobacterium talmoniae]
MPSATSPQPARSQLARAAAIGSRSSEEATPFLTALGDHFRCYRTADFPTAASTARLEARLPTVIRTPPVA